jgi:hypothetical protein
MKKQTQQIGPRIVVTKSSDQEIQIEIDQKVERWKLSMLLSWLLAWAYCGGVFIYYAVVAQALSDRIFFIVSTSLWLYFFVRIGKAFLWRRIGKEKIWIRPGEMEIQNAFGSKGKKEKLKLKAIQKLGIIKSDPGNFLAFLDDSFWVIGGERIGFVHGSTNYRVGKQLDIRSAENLVRVMDSAIKAYSKA